MEDDDTIAPVDATLPSGGFDATVAPGATLASLASLQPAPKVIVRGGGADYSDLVAIDPAHYVIGNEIARGGMGRILAARDRRLGRRVAIKELLGASPDARARFEREARITAKLQHPAIVNILEAGAWPNGEPFYVMRLVTGTSLDAAIAARPTLATRLELLPNVIAVVDALAYAHSEQVIHRDLKPANVLVGGFGETVVIDWGLAKDLADASGDPEPAAGPFRGVAGETEIGAVMGTPAYMPLEQAMGEAVDQRADVYALGALLYHLIAGKPPYVATTSGEVLARVIDGPPPPLGPETPAELVAIVGKAMARDARDRYPTAQELAADLKKFATGNLVGAHTYSTWQLVRRWLRRHRTAVIVAGIAAAVLIAVGTISVVRIVEEQARTEEQRGKAVTSRASAEDLITFMLVDLRAKLATVGKLPLLEEVARKALDYYATRTDSVTEQEQRKRAIAITSVGEVLVDQGDLPAALAQHQAALALRTDLAAAAPRDPKRRTDLADSHQHLAGVLNLLGKPVEAMAEARASFAIVDALAAEDPDVRDRQRNLGNAHVLIGNLLADHDAAGALGEFRAGNAIFEKLVSADPANHQWRHDRWNARGNIGNVLLAQGDHAGALAEFRAMQAILEAGPSDPTDQEAQHALGVTHDRIGSVLRAQGDVANAMVELSASTAIGRRLVERDPTNASWLRDLSVDLVAIGDMMTEQKDQRALEQYQAALEISTRLTERDPKNVAWRRDFGVHHARIGNLLLQRGDLKGARPHLDTSLAIRQSLADADPKNQSALMDLARGYNNYGELLEKEGDAEAALAMFRKYVDATAKLAALLPNEAAVARELAVAYDRVGSILVDKHEIQAALPPLRASLAIAERLAHDDPKSTNLQDDLSLSYLGLGKALFAAEDLDGAYAALEASRAIRDKLLAQQPDNEDWQANMASVQIKLGRVAQKRHDNAAASLAYHAALAIDERLAAHAPAETEWQSDLEIVHWNIGLVLEDSHDLAGAAAEYRRALAYAEKLVAGAPKDAHWQAEVAEITAKLKQCCPKGLP